MLHIDFNELVIIRGAGDLATGVAHRVWQAGFPLVLLEVAQPTVVRRTVSFAAAVFQGTATVEGVTTCKIGSIDEVRSTVEQDKIPLLVDPAGESIARLKPGALVDAIMAKKNLGTSRTLAPLVIALGPGFTAGVDVDAVVETMRGHHLGRVIWDGKAIPDTGIPGEVGGATTERLIRAPGDGIWEPLVQIGDFVQKGQRVAVVGDFPVESSITGVVRGLLHPGVPVRKGMKAGDVDPRAEREHCFTLSDKARAVGGGVLEALLHGLTAKGGRSSGCI